MGEVEDGAFFFIRAAVCFQLRGVWCILTAPADTGTRSSGWVVMIKKKLVNINEALCFHVRAGNCGCAVHYTCFA